MADKDPLDEFMALPRDHQLSTLQMLPAPTQDKILGEVKTRITNLTANPKKHGIYAMEDESGNQLGVSFDKVDEAGRYGYQFSNKITVPNAKGREDYAKDRFAALQPPKNAKNIGTRGNLLEGRFFKGGKVVPQTPIPSQVKEAPTAWQGLRETMQKAAVPTGENRPVDPSKTHSLVDSAWNLVANHFDKAGNVLGVAANTVFGAADMVPQIYNASKDALSYDPYKATTGAATLMQMMPSSMAKNYIDHLKEVHKQNPSYAVDDVIGTTMGVWASGKLTEKGANVVTDPMGTVKAIREAPGKIGRSTVEAITNTQPRYVKAVGEEALGKALEHKEATQEELGKRSDAHDKEVAKVKEHNARVAEKHKVASEKIQMERKAAEHALELRRSEEAGLEKDATDLFKKVDVTKAKVKAAADAEWNPIHQALDDKTIDGGDIEKPLAKIIKISPEVQREINQLIPDPSDAAPDSQYAQDRAAIMKSQGIKGSYWELDPDKRAIIDRIAESSGFAPEPIDLDPKAGVGIPFDKVHRAQSIIGRNIREGRYGYEGSLLGEMKQLQKTLYNAESRIATDNGMSADLDDARQATREYHEAFGRDRSVPKNNPDNLKKGADIEKFKADEEQELLDAVSKHDPTLAQDYKKVKERREATKKMKTEDQLRESLPQPIPPPSVNHPVDTYRLKPEPEPFNPKPVERDEPTGPRKHDVAGKTLWKEDELKDKQAPVDYATKKAEKLKAFQKTTRDYGLRRAIYASFTSIPAAIVTALLGKPGVAALEAGVGPAVLLGSQLLANLMDKPEVAAWVEKVTPKDVAEFDKLPPAQKALFTQDMRDLADAARKKGIRVSPALNQFVSKPAVKAATRVAGGYAGVSGSTQPNLEQIKKKAQELQTQPPPQESAPGPQSGAKPAWTHVFNPSTGQIESV